MTEKKQIYIRADGNSEIGMGHVMRCLAVAEEIRQQGGEVRFLLAGEQAVSVLKQAGFESIVMETDYRNTEEEIPWLSEHIREGSVFLVDSYFVTENYLLFLRTKGMVCYVDDVNRFSYPADVIINGNVYGAETEYVPYFTHTQVWGGLDFSPLRREYAAHRGKRREEYILVTTGSSDPYLLAEKIVRRLLQERWAQEEKLCVVCGRFSQSFETLKELEKEHANLMVLSNVADMWNVMNRAKFAVTAAGSTMNELAALGIPMIGFSFVDNQERIARVYKEKGYSHYGGDYLLRGDEMSGEIVAAAKELWEDEKLRASYSDKLMRAVDGLGSARIAEKMLKL